MHFMFSSDSDVIAMVISSRTRYPIDTFLSVAIANAHLLLLVFSWSFMGTKVF